MKTELLIKTGSRQCRHLMAAVALSFTAVTANADAIQTGETVQPADTVQTFNAVAADPDSCFIGRFAGHALYIPNVDTSFTVNLLTGTDDGFTYRFTPNPGTFVEDLTTGQAFGPFAFPNGIVLEDASIVVAGAAGSTITALTDGRYSGSGEFVLRDSKGVRDTVSVQASGLALSR